MRVGADFYLVTSTFEYFPGIPVYHSTDLVNWELVGHALHDASQVDLDAISSGGGVHASTIRYNDGLFYVITTNVRDSGPVNFVVTAPDPRGPWSAPRIIEDAPGIDPSLLFDDGVAWYVGNHAPDDPAFPGEMEIWLQKLDVETMSLSGERHYLWRGCCQGAWAEGPHIYRKDGHYYLLISEGGTAYEHALSVAVSTSITGPYQNNPRNPILTHRQLSYDFPVTGVGHADFVELEDGRWYAVLLGWRLIDGLHGTLGRETFLAPVVWETEPYPWKQPKYTFPVVSPRSGRVEHTFPLPFAGQRQRDAGNLIDNFDAAKPGPEWNMRRTHDAPFFSLEARPGFLRLNAGRGALRESEHYSFVGIRQRHFQFVAETEMQLEAPGPDDEAGIIAIQNDRSALVMSLRDNEVLLYHTRNGERTRIAARAYSGDTIRWRVAGDYLQYDFWFAEPGGEWQLLAADVDGTVLSPAVIDGFNYTGVYIGLYATANGTVSSAVADYDYFHYRISAESRDHWYHRQLDSSRQ